jgi:hypothetical protein
MFCESYLPAVRDRASFVAAASTQSTPEDTGSRAPSLRGGSLAAINRERG